MPSYTIRGIGYVDLSLAGTPAVSLYADEIPIPFPIESRGLFLDVARVEVLKGPQGTLFGSNSTGGLINAIAAKPTETFDAGLDLSYGRFNTVDASGFVSGPLGEDVRVRLALQHTRSDDWQQSYTSSATNGDQNFTAGRLLLEWTPTDKLSILFNVNGWIDKSETQAPQLIAVAPQPGPQDFIQNLLDYPLAPRDSRAADFDLGVDYGRRNKFAQGAIRIGYDLSDDFTLTSLTAASIFDQHQRTSSDGTALPNGDSLATGGIESYYQELRLSGAFADQRGNFTLGANYSVDATEDRNLFEVPQSVLAASFLPLGAPALTNFVFVADQDIQQAAGFLSGDFDVTDTINVYGGVRYTKAKIEFTGGPRDSGDNVAATVFGVVGNFVRGLGGLPPIPNPPPGGFTPLLEDFTFGRVDKSLTEDNVSWRAGVRWTPQEDTMFYANISRGYKLGSFSVAGSTNSAGYAPATQEEVLSYEAGFKLGLMDRALQVNAAVFYYDYTDKQVFGHLVDPAFGPITRLVNIPESRGQGAELEVIWSPIKGLRMSAVASYIDTKILGSFPDFDGSGQPTDFGGSQFPNAPNWQAALNVDYTWRLTDGLNGLAGANFRYQSDTYSRLGELDEITDLDSYGLLDLRVGVETGDGVWRFLAWGRNVTDEYYWSASNRFGDVAYRNAGLPATYGVSLAYRY